MRPHNAASPPTPLVFYCVTSYPNPNPNPNLNPNPNPSQASAVFYWVIYYEVAMPSAFWQGCPGGAMSL